MHWNHAGGAGGQVEAGTRDSAAAAGGGRGRARAFTLIELLVVIGIIGVLVALLLPALSEARESARVSVCLSNLHQFYVAACGYSSDFRDFPHSAKQSVRTNVGVLPVPLQPSGEHAGFQVGGYWDGTSWVQKPVYMLMMEGRYSPRQGLMCTSTAPGAMFPDPGGNWTWSGNSYYQYYCYIGPAAMQDVVASYGHNSGLVTYGRMYAMGNVPIGTDISGYPEDFFGVSVRNRTNRAMACCPTLQTVFGTSWAGEPHYNFPFTASDRQGGESWTKRRRNYMYSDGHGLYASVDR